LTNDGEPAIENRPVSNLTTNRATFNAYLDSTGTSATVVCVLWGENTNAWANTNPWNAGAWKSESQPSTNLSLNPNRGYYYTFRASNAKTNVTAAQPVFFMTGEVSVRVTRRESTEERPAAFVISRPATAANGALEVCFTLGGTGVSGVDYDRLDSPAVIPPGATEVQLPVVPCFNLGEKQPKTVELSIAPGGYLIGADSKVTILTRAE
jgi:hypothetical protein